MSAIALILAALSAGEAVPALLALFGLTGRAALVARAGFAIAPRVLNGLQSLASRPDLTPDELAAVQAARARDLRDLGGPMGKHA